MARAQSAVVGIGATDFSKAGASRHGELTLAMLAITCAVDDAGLAMGDVDGLVSWSDGHDAAALASWLGFGNLRFTAQAWGGGGNLGAATVNLADAAVRSGQADVVVVFRALTQTGAKRMGRTASLDDAEGQAAYLSPFGAAAPVVRNALMTRAFMDRYDISQEALAEIALASYAHAQRNPRAVMYGRPLTREAYHASRMIAEPFHLYDCCQASDGAVALVITRADRARDLAHLPAYIVAGAVGMEARGGLWAMNDSAFPNGRFRTVAERLWRDAGVTPADVDVAQFYENFTGTTLIAISDMGFAAPEEIEDFVQLGNLQWPGGALPINTSGGNLAEGYIHGLQLVAEAVRQIRGESTAQVRDARLSLSVAGPGTPPSSAVLFAREL